MSTKAAKKKQKDALLENIKKIPIVQLACQKVDIGRATFYRWKKEDKKFGDEIDEAMTSGISIINDMAESKLIGAIKEGHMTGIIYWLKHHHPAYATRVELSMQHNRAQDELTPEQQELVAKSLALAGIAGTNPSADTYDQAKQPGTKRRTARKNKK